jgi:hypothetical protein
LQSLKLAIAGFLTALSGPALSHGGLDGSSPTIVVLHALAHLINDHPVVLVLFLGGVLALGGALTRMYELYRCAQSKRRQQG